MTTFDDAYKNAGTLKGGSDQDKLEFYALGKIAKGEDIGNAPKPGMFDMAGKFKRKEWQKLVDDGISQQDAKNKYVAKFEKMKAEHGVK